MSYELEGTIKLIEETQTFGSGFQKREFVVTTDEKYPQTVPLEFVNDKIDLLDKIRTGDRVKVSFNLRGNEYKGRYYVNLQAWRIEVEGSQEGVGDSVEEDVPLDDKPSGIDDLEESPF